MKKVLSLLVALVLMAGVASFASAEALEPVALTIMFHGSNVTDDSAVMEKVNAYLAEKINATLDVIWGTWGDFDTNATMSLNAGDPIDMYFTCSWSQDEYNAYAKKGMWTRLDDPNNNLIEKYAADLWATLPQVLTEGATIEGSDGLGVYAVPGYKDIATQNCWDVNVTLLEKYGYTLDDIKNADYYSFGDILKTVKEGEGDAFYPLLVEGMVLERMVTNSIIVAGDSGSTNLLSYYINPADTAELGAYGNVMLNKFATDEYKKFVEKTREYFLAGYIDPAMAVAETANDTRVNKQLTGQYLIGTQSYALGYELQASQERNIHVEMVPVTPPYVDTTSSQGAMVAISTASANPDRAMMFLNLLNTDPTLMTLLNYGVESIHYNLTGDGLVEFTDKRADYQPWTNGMGNVTLLPPTVGQGVGFWDTFKAYYGEAHKIPIIGFTFDSTPVQVEMSALANVAAEFALALDTGAVDPTEKLPEFLQKLDAAGMQTYLDTANAQLTAFLAAK